MICFEIVWSDKSVDRLPGLKWRSSERDGCLRSVVEGFNETSESEVLWAGSKKFKGRRFGNPV